MMKKHLTPLIAGLFVILGITQAFANGEELKLPIPRKIIEETVSEYLSSTSLEPYVRPGPIEARIISIIDPIIVSRRLSVVYIEVELDDDEKSLKGLFAICLMKATNTVQAKLFCLSDSPLITPQLFFDIVNGPQFALSCPEGMKLLSEQNGHIFISSDDSNIEEKRMQTWTLFTANESYDVPVTLMNDGKGGTYFTISIR